VYNIVLKLKAEQYALNDDAAKPESDEAKGDNIAVDIDSDPEQIKAVHPQTKFS
jgi:hypothetical protein